MAKFSLSTSINAPKQQVWQVLEDFGGTYRWNPNVVESHSTTDASSGPGAERRCDLGKGNWTEERITGWREGKSLDIAIIGSNVPISRAVVTLNVEEIGDSATKVDLDIEYKLKFGPVGVLMDVLMARRAYRKAMNGLLAGLKYYVETGEEVGTDIPVATAS